MLIGGLILSFYHKDPECKVRLRCRYMAYACGECGPKYMIDEVIKEFQGKLDRKQVIGKDVKIVFSSGDFERQLDSRVQACAICYDYYIDGRLRYLAGKGYYEVNADTCVIQLRDKRCCQ